MNKILITKAFEEARIKKEKQGLTKPSQTDISKELSDFIEKSEGFGLGERTFRDYYNEASKLKDDSEDISIKQVDVINGLCKYIGYDNYVDFSKSLENKNMNSKPIVNNTVIAIILLVVVGLIVYSLLTRQRWMVWKEDHYVEVKFDLDEYSINQLKVYKEERIEKFRKINPDCDYTFFNTDGSVRVWYGKNINKELEFFTDMGLHPETSKTLKPITKYMINKYVCNTSD